MACTAASSPFCWVRVRGLERLAAAIEVGVAEDFGALTSSLDQTYSQVLEVVLSSLDRQLLLPPDELRPPPAAAPGAAASGPGAARSRLQQELAHHQAALSPGAPPLPGGLAPGHAGPGEWAAAMRAAQGACILHPKTRAVLGTAQYLQLIVSRACSCPPCAPPALDALLAIAAASPEAQALFVGNAGLDAVARLARGGAAEPNARRGGGGGGPGGSGGGGGGGGGGGAAVAAVARGVRLRCLGFIHVFVAHVLSRGVRSGQVHPNTLRAAQQLLTSELGQAAADLLTKTPAEISSVAAAASSGGGGAGGAPSSSGGGGGAGAVERLAEAALSAMESGGRMLA